MAIKTARPTYGTDPLAVTRKLRKVAVSEYCRLLGLLKSSKVLGAASVYVPSGFDFFPALFTRAYCFNNRAVGGFDFFADNIRGLGFRTRRWNDKLRLNLRYFNVVDGADLGAVRKLLAESGFFSIRGGRSLILKGTMLDLFEKEFDPDTERYFPSEDFLGSAKSWLSGILGMFDKGDFVLAFDGDGRFFPHEGCHLAGEFTLRSTEGTELLMKSPYNATTRLYLPRQLRIYRYY